MEMEHKKRGTVICNLAHFCTTWTPSFLFSEMGRNCKTECKAFCLFLNKKTHTHTHTPNLQIDYIMAENVLKTLAFLQIYY